MAIVQDDWPRRLEPTQTQEPSPFDPSGFTLAVLPDTQYYASCRERHFGEQSRWLSTQLEKRNILATLHLGDITEHNSPEEWQYAVDSLSPLKGKVPLFLATGNHDYGDLGTADVRETLFQDFFSRPAPPTAQALTESMRPGDLENAYYRLALPGHRRSAPGQDQPMAQMLGVLVLEWSPRRATVAWAKKLLARYPHDRVVFVTHAYLYHDGTRYDWAAKGDSQEWNPKAYGTAKKDPTGESVKDNWSDEGAYDGEMLWQELLSDHPGLFLTLNGHVLGDGSGHLASQGSSGNTVHQVLTNYQMLEEGGLGYLRLVEITGDGRTMHMKTYSPSLNRWATADDQDYALDIVPPLW